MNEKNEGHKSHHTNNNIEAVTKIKLIKHKTEYKYQYKFITLLNGIHIF